MTLCTQALLTTCDQDSEVVFAWPGLGRLGGATLGYYVVSSLVAITVGIVLVNVIRPGDGLDYATLVSAALKARGQKVSTLSLVPPMIDTAEIVGHRPRRNDRQRERDRSGKREEKGEKERRPEHLRPHCYR